jgi:hypothetical protein
MPHTFAIVALTAIIHLVMTGVWVLAFGEDALNPFVEIVTIVVSVSIATITVRAGEENAR